jgi:hypothetical protein
MKLHGSKVGHFEFAGGRIGFAYAGNTRFAFSAIQKLQKRLQAVQAKDALAVIEKVLDAEYRRNVLSHPDHATDASIPYSLLLAIWSPTDGTRLYVTAQTAIQEVNEYECIGVGDYLGHYLMRQAFSGGMLQRDALALAAYALAGIKDYVSGCGGMSVYVLLQNDGRVSVLTSLHDGVCSQLQKYAKTYDFITRGLLIALANEDSSDADFERFVAEVFVPTLVQVRRDWTKLREQRLTEFTALNRHLGKDEAKELFREFSLGLPPVPPLSKP